MSHSRIYLTTCDTFDGWTHVEHSTETEEAHCERLQAEFEVSGPFSVAGSVEVADGETVERAMDDAFSDRRQPHGFFAVDPLEAIAKLAEIPDPASDRIRIRDDLKRALEL